jgi:integrase
MEATMTRLLTPTSILLTVILLAVNIPALAVDRTFQIEVENSLKGTVPSNWWLHASWRDQTLVVFVSPPTQESFDLWYDTPRQKETLENLCKAIPVAIWNQIPPDQASPSSRLSAAMAAKAAFSFRAEHIWLSRPINGDTQIAARIGSRAKMPFPIHPHMLRHGCGYALANAGHDTRSLQAWLGHKNIQHTVRYTELAPDRFRDFWR